MSEYKKDILQIFLQQDIKRLKENDETLNDLYLSNLRITDKDARKLANALYQNIFCKTLKIAFSKITDKGINYLSNAFIFNIGLQKLLLERIITNKGIKHLSNALYYNSTLQVLELFVCNITDEGIKHLANALYYNTSLKTIDLIGYKMTNKGIEYLANILYYNTSLQEIDLFGCNIKYQGTPERKIKYLENALIFNQSIIINDTFFPISVKNYNKCKKSCFQLYHDFLGKNVIQQLKINYPDSILL